MSARCDVFLRPVAGMLLAGLALTVSPAAPAAAQEIAGSWTFETGRYANGCSQKGRMRVTPAQKGGWSCTFVTIESCGPEQMAEVEQSCTITRSGKQLLVKSAITRIARQEPEAYGYVADNFALTVKSADELFGSLLSANTAWARFRRQETPIS